MAVIAGGNESALTAADCGIGVISAGTTPPWAAHVLCGPGLTDAWLILRAARSARTTADRSTHLALLGAVTGALIGLAGPEHTAGRRSTLPVNVAALASIVASVWSVNRLSPTNRFRYPARTPHGTRWPLRKPCASCAAPCPDSPTSR